MRITEKEEEKKHREHRNKSELTMDWLNPSGSFQLKMKGKKQTFRFHVTRITIQI